jgi:Icc-related predicted phosphoesterase
MKILAMSDLHGHLPDVEAYLDFVDVILIAGDIAPDHSNLPIVNTPYQTEWFNTKFLEWATRLNKPVYGCYGNHDYGAFENNAQIQLYSNEIVGDFFLFSWTPKYGDWNYMVKDFDDDIPLNRLKGSVESRLDKKLWGRTGKTPAIWVCHGPPSGVCDGAGIGSNALLEAIKRRVPKAVFCGHAHYGTRQGLIGDTWVFNCALTDYALDLVREPVWVEI